MPVLPSMHDDAFWLHRETTDGIIRIFWDVVNELGTGYLERIHVRAMVMALTQAGFNVTEGYSTVVYFRGVEIGRHVFDLVVNGIVVELKATTVVERAHVTQLLGYLRSSEFEVGLLLNFGLKPSVNRVVLTNDRKTFPTRERGSAPSPDAAPDPAPEKQDPLIP